MPNCSSRGHPTGWWLPILQKAHALMDRAARAGWERLASEHGVKPACGPGCAHCCRGVIPVSAPELAGAFWYAAGHCPGADRLGIERRLRGRAPGECPFLLGGNCSVYPMRFLACRQFFVFGRACAAGEDVWETRGRDIPRPHREKKLKALAELAALYGVEPPAAASFLERFVRDVSAPLHRWDLSRPDAIVDDLEEGWLRYSKV